jgi:outer membrane protein assembly factor BamB
MIYALNNRGKKVFSYQTGDTVFASLALANIDSDPALEMIGGTDISRNDAMKIKDGGFLYAFDPPVFEEKALTAFSVRDCAKIRNIGRRKKCLAKSKREPEESTNNGAYGFRDPKSFKWMLAFDQVIQSSPVVAELLSSSSGPEIVMGSGCFFPISSSSKNGAWVKVVGSLSGKVLRTFATSTCIPSSPAVADLNGDGLNEVVILVGGGDREVVAWTPATDTVLWRAEVGSSSIGLHGKQAIIADLDDNGSLEVSFGSGGSVIVLAGNSGEVLETLKVKGVVSSNPAVGDLDSDGVVDLVAVGEQLAIFKSLPAIGSEQGPVVPGLVPFGSWRGNAMRTGVGN